MRKWKSVIIITVVIILAFTGCGYSAQNSLEIQAEEMTAAAKEINKITIDRFGDVLKFYLENWKNYFGRFPEQWPLENYYGGVT